MAYPTILDYLLASFSPTADGDVSPATDANDTQSVDDGEEEAA